MSSVEIEEAVELYSKKNLKLNEYNFFKEYYTTNKKKLSEALEILSDSAYKCFSKLIANYATSENTIQYDNNINIIKDKDFAKVLNISICKWYSIKKELIENNCIRKVEFDKRVLYKINPTIIGHSMRITKCTYYAFRSELIKEFDEIKRIYWDKKLIEEFGADII